MTDIVVSEKDAATELAVLTAYSKAVAARVKVLREHLDAVVEKDTKIPVWAGDLKVGRVTKSEGGETTASVVDEDQLKAFLLAEGSAEEHTITVIDVPDWARQEALKRAENGEGIPGVLVRTSAPVLKVFVETKAVVVASQHMPGLPQLEAKP